MNEKSSTGPGCDDPTVAPPSDAPLSPRRRRLLKIGAGAAPTALLLAGRPVHAQYACTTTSAWGSYMLNPASSVKTRMQSKDFEILTWSVPDWVGNTPGAPGVKPWQALFGSEYDATKTVDDAKLGMQLTGIPLTATLDSILKGGNPFLQSILVAALNVRVRGDARGLPCMPKPTLEGLSAGFYSPAPGATPWGPDQIIYYLHENGLAIRNPPPTLV